MKYRSGPSFRQALAAHLKAEGLRSGLDLHWLQQQIAFDRLLARLVTVAPGQWILKGGLALDFRLGNHARATQDIDLAWLTDAEMAGTTLRAAGQHDAGDYFEFSIKRTRLLDDADVGGAVRFNVGCNLANRQWTNFKLDVGVSQPVLVGEPDTLSGPALLSFSGIDPIVVLALPLAQHVAEKLHAYTRTYGPQNRPSSRVKDLVDLVLIQAHERLPSRQLRIALKEVFTLRETPPIPAHFSPPPEHWRSPYQSMARALAIPSDLDEAYRLADVFLTPVLAGTVRDGHVWEPGGGWQAEHA